MVSLPIGFGFVGLSSSGWATTTLWPSLLQPSLKEKYSPIAISNTSEESSNESAAKYSEQTGKQIKAYHGCTFSIASDPAVDLVIVSLKAYLHKEAVLPVIQARKPFFVEWPAGRNTDETVEIAGAARAYGVRNMVGLQGRCSPVVRKIKELVDGGAIGKVYTTTMIASSPRELYIWAPEAKSGNLHGNIKGKGSSLLIIAGGHQLDSLTFALGSFTNVAAVSAKAFPTVTILEDDGTHTSDCRPSPFPDQYTITGRLENDILATVVLHGGYKSTPGRRRLLWEIEGEEGSIRVEGEAPYLNIVNPTLYLNGEQVELEGTESQVLGILEYAWDQYALGKEGSYATIEDAVKLRYLLDAIECSAENNGHRITLST